MAAPESYRELAARCRITAASCRDQVQKDRWLQLAKAWQIAAQEEEQAKGAPVPSAVRSSE